MSIHIPILNDLHIGAKRSNRTILDYQKKFFKTIFLPYCRKNNVSDVVIAGDLFDDDFSITLEAMSFFHWLRCQLSGLGIHIYIIPGNHDVRYKNTNAVNSIEPFLSDRHDVTVIMSPRIVNIRDFKVLMVPWVTKDNYVECKTALESADCAYCIGHFEVTGMPMPSGAILKGLPIDLFGNFDRVLNGHIHHRSVFHNILNMGVQYELDHGDGRTKIGFNVAIQDEQNTDWRFEYVQNPYRIFRTIRIASDLTVEEIPVNQWIEENRSALIGNFVKLVFYHVSDKAKVKDVNNSFKQIGLASLKAEYIDPKEDDREVDFDDSIHDKKTKDLIDDHIKEVFPQEVVCNAILKVFNSAYQNISIGE